ncbi:dihydroneopterin aldolase, partial [Listeria monocytogenes]|nr:dihydroneopterin aldolase [Listeria monocytogenes]
ATEVLTGYPLLEEVTVKLIKPNPPIPGHYDSVAVEIERKRSDLNG